MKKFEWTEKRDRYLGRAIIILALLSFVLGIIVLTWYLKTTPNYHGNQKPGFHYAVLR